MFLFRNNANFNCYWKLCFRAVVFDLGYAYPRGYAKTSEEVRKIKKYIYYFMINTE